MPSSSLLPLLLHLTPLLTTTASLTFAFTHDLFFRVFLDPRLRAQVNSLLPGWMKPFMSRGLPVILTFYSSTFLSALANIYLLTPSSTTGSDPKTAIRGWYAGGAIFTVGHFVVFGQRAVGLLVAMREDRSKGKGTDDLRAWVRMNIWRSLTVDAAAWGCFLVGALKALS